MLNEDLISNRIIRNIGRFKELDGYIGIAVYSPDGRMLGGVTEVLGINFEIVSQLFHDAFLIIDNRSREGDFGEVDLMQLNTAKGIVLGKCFKEEGLHFHAILVVASGTDIDEARVILDKFMKSLMWN